MDHLSRIKEISSRIEKWSASCLKGEPESCPELNRAMAYTLLSGGKRLRGVLLVLSAGIFSCPVERVIPAASAIEMVHAYSLIHDDLPCMDDDDMRRGKPSNHKVFGESMALLAGDALLTESFFIMAESLIAMGFKPETVLKCISEMAFAAGKDGMVGGQVMDIKYEGVDIPPEMLKRIHRMKTGALIRASVRIGAILGASDEADLNRLTRFAERLGLAFQITDDILDVVGDPEKTGKPGGSDKKNQKTTYPGILGLDGAKKYAERLVGRAIIELKPYGKRGEILSLIAEMILKRDH